MLNLLLNSICKVIGIFYLMLYFYWTIPQLAHSFPPLWILTLISRWKMSNMFNIISAFTHLEFSHGRIITQLQYTENILKRKKNDKKSSILPKFSKMVLRWENRFRSEKDKLNVSLRASLQKDCKLEISQGYGGRFCFKTNSTKKSYSYVIQAQCLCDIIQLSDQALAL